MDDGITLRELRDGVADMGKLELAYFNLEADILSAGPELLKLHKYLEDVFNGSEEFSLSQKQSKIVFLCVRFASVYKTLSRTQSELEAFAETNL